MTGYFSEDLMQRVLALLQGRAKHGGCTLAELARHTDRREDTIAKVIRIVGRKSREGTPQRDALYLPHDEAAQRMANYRANTVSGRMPDTLRVRAPMRVPPAIPEQAEPVDRPRLTLTSHTPVLPTRPAPILPVTPEGVQRAILRVLRITEESVTLAEIVRDTGLAHDLVQAELDELLAEGRVVKLLRIRPGRTGTVTTIAYTIPSTRGAA